jgi:tetratricopeptide (TPR) repeat protein
VGALGAVWLCAAMGVAQDLEEEAQARIHFEAGRLHYDHGRFDEAGREFAQAYEMTGNPALLYNLYLVHRDAGRVEAAAEALEGYLERVPDPPRRAGLEARLRSLKAQLAARGDGGEPQAAEPALPAPEPALDDARVEVGTDDRSGATRPPLGAIVAMGTGGALLVGAVVTGVMTKSAESTLRDGCPERVGCDPELESTRDRARRLAIVTDVLWITGAAAAVGGLLWLLLRRPGEEEQERPAVSFGCAPGGCSIGYERSF